MLRACLFSMRQLSGLRDFEWISCSGVEESSRNQLPSRLYGSISRLPLRSIGQSGLRGDIEEEDHSGQWSAEWEGRKAGHPHARTAPVARGGSEAGAP